MKIIYTNITGVSNARNLGIVNSTFNFIVFIDDDDIISSNMLQSFYTKAINNGIVAAKFQSFKEDLLNLTDDYVTRSYNRCRKFNKFNIIRFRGFLSSACGKLIPRSMIGDKRFNTGLSKGEDSLFMFSISGSIKNIILAESDVIYFRRLRPGSATRNAKNKKHILSNAISLYKNYNLTYMKSPFYYNFFFFLTRLAAITKLTLKRLNHSQQ
jgi:glycosyltransferase involved in cell wall biosynthesis